MGCLLRCLREPRSSRIFRDVRGVHDAGGAAHRLDAQRDRVLRLWEERVRREIPAAAREPRPVLVDTLPAFLSHLAEALTPGHPRRTATEGSTVPEEHGGERVRLTRYALRDVIREYQLLRDVLLEVLDEEGPLTAEERKVIVLSIDTAVADACTAYVLVSEGLREKIMVTLAHDLRSPLSAAKAGAALILRRPADPSVPRWASRIDENIERVDRMLRSLLDVSRAGSGAQLALDLGPCDLVAVVRGIVERLELSHGDRFVVIAPGELRGTWSADALGRAVENLVANALKYGDPHQRVTITLATEQERASVAVHNHGSFIPQRERETLFEAFRRSEKAEKSVRGWGLGLALVRAVAEAHGGSISVESLPGTGTTFLIDLPLDSRPFQKAPSPAS